MKIAQLNACFFYLPIQLNRLIQDYIWLLLVLSSISNSAYAGGQHIRPDSTLIRTTTIKDYRRISGETGVYIDRTKQTDLPSPSADFDWQRKDYVDNYIPLENTVFPHFYQFSVYNDQPDAVILYFHVSENEAIRLWQHVGSTNVLREIPAEYYQPNPNLQVAYFRLTLLPQQRQTYMARLQPIKQAYFSLRPYLMTSTFLPLFFQDNTQGLNTDTVTSLIFCGMLGMMLLYMLAKSVQIRSAEYFYYAGYIAFFLGYFILKTILFSRISLYQNPFVYSYLNNILQVLAYCMYFQFFRKFLNTSTLLPHLDKVLTIATVVMLTYALLDLVALYWLPDHYLWRIQVWHGIRISLTLLTLYSINQLLRVKNLVIVYYLLAGTVSFAILGLVAMVLSGMASEISNWIEPFDSPLFYFKAGIAVELICFSLGLGYKNRMAEIQKKQAENTLKLERELQAFEQYKVATEAREAERKRIGGEMHDDMGSGLTSILFLTNTLRSQLVDEGVAATTDKISLMAISLVDNMNDIVWSMNAQHDTLESLVAYLRSQMSTLLENAELPYQFQVEEPIPLINLSGEQRRNIYLVVKEAVHNLIKHAQASQVIITLTFDQQICLTIRDNGRGFDPEALRKWGNGLKNMQQRMKNVHGEFQILKDAGTVIHLEVPINPLGN
ncbi:MAG: 7TM diverse intracellular signaling domain-containing protein [Bacteroidota bacterium]